MSSQTEKDNQKIICKNHKNPADVTRLLCSGEGWKGTESVGLALAQLSGAETKSEGG